MYAVLKNGQYQIWKSDQEIVYSTASGSQYYDPNSGTYVDRATSTRSCYHCDLTSNACILTWNGEKWVYSMPAITCGSNMSSVYKTLFAEYNSTTTVADSADSITDFPEVNEEDINEIINSELNSTTEVSTQANVYVTNITNVYNSYTSGDITLEEAKAEVESNVDSLSELAQEPTATLKDAITVQNGLTYGQIVNDTLLQEQEEAYWNERDIDSSVSTKVQQSDQEEIDYLESLIAETEKTISELSPSKEFTSEQISTASEIVEGVWENPIIKKLIPVAACFMVVCVVLGVKYRL